MDDEVVMKARDYHEGKKSGIKDVVRRKHVNIYEEADVKELLETGKKYKNLSVRYEQRLKDNSSESSNSKLIIRLD
ncbi:hypothetical protein P7K49_005653 [Saguinus oedipus]|uniref:Uncharacterized protein n=1 Tax=Saguinus oedipus TaxID=9490 RepID=A0ABQ9W2N2_SAGOE|nr:hypothetical protein P7K49_005653 [Saguinus oedipus]